MRNKIRRRRRDGGVTASELAQIGVCERLVQFEHQQGRLRTDAQLQDMGRGLRAHERLYLDGRGEQMSRGRCFVATMVFGESPETQVLKQFRDRVMRPRVFGRWLIAAYYRLAPAVCRLLERRPASRRVVRWVVRGVARIAAHWLDRQGHRDVR